MNSNGKIVHKDTPACVCVYRVCFTMAATITLCAQSFIFYLTCARDANTAQLFYNSVETEFYKKHGNHQIKTLMIPEFSNRFHAVS